MPLPTEGEISLDEIHVEAGGTTSTEGSINDTDIRDLITKSAGVEMAFSEWYGASASPFNTGDFLSGGTKTDLDISAPYNTGVRLTFNSTGTWNLTFTDDTFKNASGDWLNTTGTGEGAGHFVKVSTSSGFTSTTIDTTYSGNELNTSRFCEITSTTAGTTSTGSFTVYLAEDSSGTGEVTFGTFTFTCDNSS